MEILIKFFVFLCVVSLFPLYFVMPRGKNKENMVGEIFLGAFIGVFIYLGIVVFVSFFLPRAWVTTGEYHLNDLKNNYFVEKQRSGKVYRDVEINRYNYVIKQGNDYMNYWVNYNIASVKIEDGALDLKIQKKLYVDSNITKYFIPKFIIPERSEQWYTFYVDPQYAKENLGLQLK